MTARGDQDGTVEPAVRRRRAAREQSPPTREVILDTAERLSPRTASTASPCAILPREMGLTAPSLYNHFPSKQALYEAVLERGLQPILQAVAEAWNPGALRPDRCTPPSTI